MRCHILASIVSVQLATALTIPGLSTCQTKSQSNPIAQQYPNDTTGTVNGSVIVLPIPFSIARAAIPAQYPILTKQYQQWLPKLGKDMYPAMLNALYDHDIQMASLGFHVPDFSRAVFQFPFVDRLNDGSTAMTYTSQIMISNSLIAIAGSKLYGYSVTPSVFDPPCDAYNVLPNGDTSFSAIPDLGGSGINTHLSPLKKGDKNPYSLNFIKNITNQPQFGDTPLVCDNFIRLFNTSVTTGKNSPTPVKGTVSVASPYAPVGSTWTNVYGYNLDTAFIEKNLVMCSSLAGYSG